MRNKSAILSLLLLVGYGLHAQTTVWEAVIQDEDGVGLPIVEVYNAQTQKSTNSRAEGKFRIEVSEGDSVYFRFPETEDRLIVAHLDQLPSIIRLEDRDVLEEAVVQGRSVAARFDRISANQVLNIGKNEFRKAACCTLSESFDNTPSVDVSYSDGLTGMKQIQLLGLQMSDILMTMEGIPYINGASGYRGLAEIPATWVESMQLSKGVASVVNGKEGNAGQLNIELKKPLDEKGIELNLYQNSMGRTELNANGRWRVSDKLYVSLLTHGSSRWSETDQNHDGFLDRPLATDISVTNKWQYYSDERGIASQVNLIYASQNTEYGGIESDPALYNWTGRQDYERKALTWKMGKLFEDQDWKSVGMQLMASDVQNSQRIYTNYRSAHQRDFYANLIYQTILRNDKNVLRMGINAYSKNIEEFFTQDPLSSTLDEYTLDEKNLGAYLEYNYTPNDDFTLVIGNRVDYNTVLDFVYTPRFHIKYKIRDIHTLKAQFGKATMINSILQENLPFMNTTRKFKIHDMSINGIGYYGMPAQISWNAGLQYLVSIPIGEELLSLSTDFQRTWFTSGYLRDFESPDEIVISALHGDYISQVAQVQADMDLGQRWSFRLAYRYNDVKITYGDGRFRRKPLVPLSKSFVNVEYHARKWMWSHTLARTGAQRLSDSYYPDAQVSGNQSPAYLTYSSQFTYTFSPVWELYAGAENITGYTQNLPVYQNLVATPARLESALIWGPINRQVVYLGVNVFLNKH